MNVALVYDRVNKIGGAEQVLLTLHEIWPEAPLYTAVYNPQTTSWADCFRVIPSFINRLPLAKTHHELYPWLTPIAFESFSFDQFDLIISVTSTEAKGIITKPSTKHICYCLTPTRYLWSASIEYRQQPGFGKLNTLAAKLFSFTAPKLRIWDRVASTRADKYIAISRTVASRIRKYYGIDAAVIYPPIDTDIFTYKKDEKVDDYYLTVSRLVPYKRVDLLIRAFNQLGWNLTIVGKGTEEKYLRSIAASNISFVSDLTQAQLVRYYRRSRAFVSACNEDFGIVSLESQACGRPVVAFGEGGFSETVVPKVTGTFFYQQDKDAIIKCLTQFDYKIYSPFMCRRNALRYNKSRFSKQFSDFVKNSLNG